MDCTFRVLAESPLRAPASLPARAMKPSAARDAGAPSSRGPRTNYPLIFVRSQIFGFFAFPVQGFNARKTLRGNLSQPTATSLLPARPKSLCTAGNWFWKGCKPNSVCALASGENHLSMQPIPGTRFACAKPGAGRSGVPYLALHPMGFSVPRCLRFERCALTAPFHPCQL